MEIHVPGKRVRCHMSASNIFWKRHGYKYLNILIREDLDLPAQVFILVNYESPIARLRMLTLIFTFQRIDKV